MRCPYCFQEISDRSDRCPHCGSRLSDVEEPGTGKQSSSLELSTPTRKALVAVAVVLAVGGALLLCLAATIVLVPGLVPQPVARLFPSLATSTPLPTRQATTAPLPTQVPEETWVTAQSRRGGFSINVPEDWYVLDQGVPSWQRELRMDSEQYPWLADLFVANDVPFAPRLQATDLALVQPDAGRVVRVSVGASDLLTSTHTLEAAEIMVRDDPELLARVVGDVTNANFAARRLERTEINGKLALSVEFQATATLDGTSVPVHVNVFFIPAGDDLMLVSMVADGATLEQQGETIRRVIESLALEE